MTATRDKAVTGMREVNVLFEEENYSIPYESTSTPHVSAIEIAKEAAS